MKKNNSEFKISMIIFFTLNLAVSSQKLLFKYQLSNGLCYKSGRLKTLDPKSHVEL